jgi:mRNA interferase MazF
VWLDFDPIRGREQRGRRPALVLSPRAYNRKANLCVVCPMTNSAKGYPFEVAMPDGHRVSGVVLADQMRSVSWSERRAELLVAAPAEVVDDARAKIGALIGIE